MNYTVDLVEPRGQTLSRAFRFAPTGFSIKKKLEKINSSCLKIANFVHLSHWSFDIHLESACKELSHISKKNPYLRKKNTDLQDAVLDFDVKEGQFGEALGVSGRYWFGRLVHLEAGARINLLVSLLPVIKRNLQKSIHPLWLYDPLAE